MLTSNQYIKKVYGTGDNPVLVECNDLKDYVCKHNRGQRTATKLFAEWIAHALLQELKVAVPTKELVIVKEEHIQVSGNCQPAFFKGIPLFATEFIEEALEWSQLNTNDAKQIINKDDILIIAFCDIWLANEDRNWNNFNLLTHPTKEGFEIVPIDHAGCFNTTSFNETTKLSQLCENETLIDTDEFRILVKPMLKNMKKASEFVDSLYLRIRNLEQIYNEALVTIPTEWNIPSTYSEALRINLFDESWLNETKQSFLTFIKSSLKLK